MLRERETAGHPIRVGTISSATGRAIALQLGHSSAWDSSRRNRESDDSECERAFREAANSPDRNVRTGKEAETLITGGSRTTDDRSVLTACDGVDVIVEVTGTVDAAVRVVLDAFEHGKHVVLENAELDPLIGPILKEKRPTDAGVGAHTRMATNRVSP